MAAVARNAPCPCGSGRKHKLCCGETRAQERVREQALERVAEIAACFPFVRPLSPAFDAWADGRCLCDVSTEVLEEGVDALPADERARIVSRARAADPVAWQHAASVPQAERMLLAAAVGAALEERCDLPGAGRFLAAGVDGDDTPADLLADVLDPTNVWSFAEAAAVDLALAALDDELYDDSYEEAWNEAVAREAQRLLTREHRERLARMVARLRARLPYEGFPEASAALESASVAFARDAGVRERVAELLLADAACLLAAAAATDLAA